MVAITVYFSYVSTEELPSKDVFSGHGGGRQCGLPASHVVVPAAHPEAGEHVLLVLTAGPMTRLLSDVQQCCDEFIETYRL